MTETGTAWNVAQTAATDQGGAALIEFGRMWAGMYRALCDGGVPQDMARSIVERQHSTHCQVMLVQGQVAR